VRWFLVHSFLTHSHPSSKGIFLTLGFTIETLDKESTMRPPVTDRPAYGSQSQNSTSQGSLSSQGVPKSDGEVTAPQPRKPEGEPVQGPPQWLQSRRKLLRAWVEASAWLKDFCENQCKLERGVFTLLCIVFLLLEHLLISFATGKPSLSEKEPPLTHPLHVTISNVREMYQTAVGAHPDQRKGQAPYSRYP
jgi:hypothetical protein